MPIYSYHNLAGKATFLSNKHFLNICPHHIIMSASMQVSFHRSGPAVYGHKEEEDSSEEEGERYLMHLACYHS